MPIIEWASVLGALVLWAIAYRHGRAAGRRISSEKDTITIALAVEGEADVERAKAMLAELEAQAGRTNAAIRRALRHGDDRPDAPPPTWVDIEKGRRP